MKHNLVAEVWQQEGLPKPQMEYRFHPTRLWRFDFAWPEQKIALEVEGGIWINGGHNRGSGFLKNLEKYNTAAVMGWRVVKCIPKTTLSRETFAMLKQLLTPCTPTT